MQQKITLKQKMQINQHTGMNSRYGVKITLPKEPWLKSCVSCGNPSANDFCEFCLKEE